jgi:hypothetical protein
MFDSRARLESGSINAARFARCAAAACLAAVVSSCAASGQRTFATPEEAAGAVVEAMRAESPNALLAIFGEESRDLFDSGDQVADWAARRRFLAAYEERSYLEPSEDGAARTIHVGELEWPFPIPIVEADGGKWLFDTPAGLDELLNRRVGRNELSSIQVCRAYIDAQREYQAVDWDGDRILEYARKFRSSPGARDGLYWEVQGDEEPSPLGELAAAAAKEGYAARREPETPAPFYGYFYRILEAQGPNALGGAYEYVVRENMIGGFALIAYPARYGTSGVKTFLTSHDGVVYEKDLGDDTEAIAGAMTLFDPDPLWTASSP